MGLSLIVSYSLSLIPSILRVFLYHNVKNQSIHIASKPPGEGITSGWFSITLPQTWFFLSQGCWAKVEEAAMGKRRFSVKSIDQYISIAFDQGKLCFNCVYSHDVHCWPLLHISSIFCQHGMWNRGAYTSHLYYSWRT